MNIQTKERDKKLAVYLAQTGIENPEEAEGIIQTHLSGNAADYPYVLFRDNSLYLFTVSGLTAAEPMRSKNGSDYLRFDGEKITQLEAQYYLGPGADVESSSSYVGWHSDDRTNNNNNNNNNNNGNNNNG